MIPSRWRKRQFALEVTHHEDVVDACSNQLMVRKFPKSLIRRAGMCVKLICVLFTNLVSLQAAAFQVDGRFTATFNWCKHASSAVFSWVLSKQSDVIRSIWMEFGDNW